MLRSATGTRHRVRRTPPAVVRRWQPSCSSRPAPEAFRRRPSTTPGRRLRPTRPPPPPWSSRRLHRPTPPRTSGRRARIQTRRQDRGPGRRGAHRAGGDRRSGGRLSCARRGCRDGRLRRGGRPGPRRPDSSEPRITLCALRAGHILGVAEGEAELRMAFQAPPASGTGPPEIRTFTSPVKVVGRPVVTVEIVDPEVRFFTGALVQLQARALMADGGARRHVEIVWTSNRRLRATVDERGFVTALSPGAVTVTATVEGRVTGTFSFEVEESPVEVVELAGPSRGRTGDVLRYSAAARDAGVRWWRGCRSTIRWRPSRLAPTWEPRSIPTGPLSLSGRGCTG